MKRKKLELGVHGSTEQHRVATPGLVAKYRAERLACGTLVEIGAGIGGQTLAFATTCKQVIAVEKDLVAAQKLRANISAANIDNVLVIEGDVFSPEVLQKLQHDNNFFCDTQRPHEEKIRSLDTVTPPITMLRSNFPSIAIEIPPQLSPDKLPSDVEKEYISVGGRLNRLTIYCGRLRRDSVAVVSLPSRSRLVSTAPAKHVRRMVARQFLYEVDTAVIKAQLLPQLLGSLPEMGVYDERKYTLLTSDDCIESSFLNPYRVLAVTGPQLSAIRAALKGFGRVVVHARLEPGEHAQFRNDLEKGLSGSKTAHLFINERECLIARKEQ